MYIIIVRGTSGKPGKHLFSWGVVKYIVVVTGRILITL